MLLHVLIALKLIESSFALMKFMEVLMNAVYVPYTVVSTVDINECNMA